MPDAACAPLPSDCPAEQRCEVTVDRDGDRVCGGEACCAPFCEVNACVRCCARR